MVTPLPERKAAWDVMLMGGIPVDKLPGQVDLLSEDEDPVTIKRVLDQSSVEVGSVGLLEDRPRHVTAACTDVQAITSRAVHIPIRNTGPTISLQSMVRQLAVLAARPAGCNLTPQCTTAKAMPQPAAGATM